MNERVAQVIEVTTTMVLAYLFLAHGDEFVKIINAVGSNYTGAVRALQGNAPTAVTTG